MTTPSLATELSEFRGPHEAQGIGSRAWPSSPVCRSNFGRCRLYASGSERAPAGYSSNVAGCREHASGGEHHSTLADPIDGTGGTAGVAAVIVIVAVTVRGALALPGAASIPRSQSGVLTHGPKLPRSVFDSPGAS